MELSVKMSASLMLAVLAGSTAIAQFLIWQDTSDSALRKATDFYDEQKVDVNDAIQTIDYPRIDVEHQRIALHESYDPLSWATAHDSQDGDITHAISVYGSVDQDKQGEYELKYVVRNSYGLKNSKYVKVIVD